VVVKLIPKSGEASWMAYFLKNSALQAELNKGFRIPVIAKPAQGTDMHVTVYDAIENTLLELWLFTKFGPLTARWGGILKNFSQSQGIMPVVNGERWGATATGLPMVCGMMTSVDLDNGVLPYPLACIISFPSSKFVSPATASDGYSGKPTWVNPPLTWTPTIEEGSRLRLPAYFIPTGTIFEKAVLTAIRDYGMVIRDKGGCFCFFCEDSISLTPYLSGKSITDTMKTIVGKFNQLEVVA